MTVTKPNPRTMWITVAIDMDVHGEIRAKAVRARKTWPVVIAEALTLWLANEQET